jgi:probable rRNA maturation factor
MKVTGSALIAPPSKMILLDPDLDPDPALALNPAKQTAASVHDKSRKMPSARTLARFLAEAQAAVRLKGEVTVLLTTDDAIRKLNRQFRGKNKPTDVLSFPAEGIGAEEIAGDLAISVPTALRQAIEQGHPLATEIKVLILHGLLHLAGYDHEADTGKMARRERFLRARLGLPQGLIERAVARPETKGMRRLKGTGFSPYIAPAKSKRTFAPEGKLDFGSQSCQGTTSVVPIRLQNEARALAPEGCSSEISRRPAKPRTQTHSRGLKP